MNVSAPASLGRCGTEPAGRKTILLRRLIINDDHESDDDGSDNDEGDNGGGDLNI